MQGRFGNWLGARRSGANAGYFRKDDAVAFCRTYEALELGGFWATDADGLITYFSEEFAARLCDGGTIAGKPLLEVFRASRGDGGTTSALPMALARHSQFSRVLVRLDSPDGPCWWSLSGKAQFNSRGEFTGFLGFFADITEERQSAMISEEDARKDDLTGLLNRRHMSNQLSRQMANCNARNLPCALMLIDLDRFKQVNDTLGHSAGDAILKQVARRLISIIGDKEKICRLGGDEFQIVLPEIEDRGELGQLAQGIISGLSQPYSVEGNRCTIGASVGIAVSPFDGTNCEDLIRNTDLALYAAKHSGRGRFRFFSGELLRAAADRRQLEEDLRDAVAKGELELNYQPIVDARTNIVTGAETLVRWNHPERGYVSPELFIPLAEESELICRLGEWILRKACEDAASWPRELRVAVNVSPVQFASDVLPAIVTSALASSRLKPSRLELEITESVLVQEGNGTDAMFKALKALGVRLALDDFGTGYSSLSYLKSAPFDKIKIDQSFVRGATRKDSRNKAIISAIVALADAVFMETTAEGIETGDQLEMIRELNVSHVQGYIYSAGRTNEDFVNYLEQGNWVIEPSGPPLQRHDRHAMYCMIGAIHDDHFYPVVLRNLSRTGALIEGLEDVPAGTQFVLDFGEGQLMVATVVRSDKDSQGVRFESELVDDGNGGLCTRHRVSPYHLAAVGLPSVAGEYLPADGAGKPSGRMKLPAFSSAREWLKIGAQKKAEAEAFAMVEKKVVSTGQPG